MDIVSELHKAAEQLIPVIFAGLASVATAMLGVGFAWIKAQFKIDVDEKHRQIISDLVEDAIRYAEEKSRHAIETTGEQKLAAAVAYVTAQAPVRVIKGMDLPKLQSLIESRLHLMRDGLIYQQEAINQSLARNGQPLPEIKVEP